MKKLVHSLGLMVALVTTSMLAGCDLYFGSHDHGSSTWNYCGSDGYYQCQGDNCTWESASCPATTNDGGVGSGYECTSSTDCAAGCYCGSNGVCTEGGFCATNADCGPGYQCDTARSSCEPVPPGCQADSDCATGHSCNTATGACVADTCAGTPGTGCSTAEPKCATGEVPLIDPTTDCYTGQCQAYASCSAKPVCENINDESDCLGRSDCATTYTGLNCHKPDGTACHSGDTNCTCQSFQFATCSTKPQ
jgi:Cys-rich repeat protein